MVGVSHLQKNSENLYWECPFGKSAFHLSQAPFVHRPLSFASLNLPRIFKMEANEAHQMFFCEMFEVSIEEDSLINSEDDICSAPSTFMTRNLQRTEGYFEHALPGYSLDEFKSHFRMTRAQWMVCVESSKLQEECHNGNKFSRCGARTWQAEHS